MTGAWVLLCVVCLIAWAYCEKRRIDAEVENFRIVEDERRAREATAPLGNADRWYG